MTGKLRLLVVAGMATGLLGLTPSASQATDFFVDDDAAGNPTPCTSAATPCQSIQAAIVQARDAGMFAGPDTINVADGIYNEFVSMTDDADTGNTIDGSGPGAIVRELSGATDIQLGDGTGSEANMVVRDLKVVKPDEVAGTASAGILVNAPGSSITNVAIDMLEPNNSDSPLRVNPNGSGATLAGLAINTNVSNAPSVFSNNASFTLRDSEIVGGAGAGSPAAVHLANVTVAKKSMLIQRSRLSRSDSLGEVVEYGDADLTIESSLIIGGATSVQGFTTFFSPTTTLRNVTMDAMTAGVNDPTGRALRASSCCGLVHLATIDSSIALEVQQASTGASGNSNITCTSSDVPQQDDLGGPGNGVIACGVAQGNTSSSPGALFAGGAPFDYHLKFGSPAIDTGTDTPAGTNGESTTDLDGQSRVLDGDNSGNARRDKGADEHVFVAPPPTGGGGGTVLTPSTPTTAAPDNSAECAALRAKLKKAKSKRKKRRIRSQLKKLGC